MFCQESLPWLVNIDFVWVGFLLMVAMSLFGAGFTRKSDASGAPVRRS